jgi:hypothetical protein
MMICPNCRAEYRQGFSHCVDCDVDLVEPSATTLVAPPSDSSAVETEDPFCEFWRGDDARVRGELSDILSEQGIPIRTFEWQDHLFNRTRLPVFRVAVPFSMFDRAEKAVAEAYGSAEEADNVMNPTEGNRLEFRKPLELPWDQKLKGPDEEIPTFWEQVTWKRKKPASQSNEEDPDRDSPGSE